MQKRIHLLRHGQTVSNPNYDEALGHPNPALDDTGRQQAELLGQRLRNHGIQAIYSSDLDRTRETAEIIQKHLHTGILFRPQLREINMGPIPMQGWQAFPEYYAEWKKHETDLPYPQGESGADVQKRAWLVMDEIIKHHHRDVAVVTHAGVILVLVGFCLGLGLEKRFRLAAPTHCSLSTLVFDSADGTLKVEHFNETAHLDLDSWKPGIRAE